MPLDAGARLGPYAISGPIGAGGMGEVYKARDTRLDRTVAIKVLPPNTAARSDVRQRFEREARAVSALNHPHICTLHDIGHEGAIDYLVMEYLEGETLADRLKRGGLPLDQTLRIATEVADALDRAHRTGIIHRDLKPGNVMLTRDGAKVLDFGLAKMCAQSSQTRHHPIHHSCAREKRFRLRPGALARRSASGFHHHAGRRPGPSLKLLFQTRVPVVNIITFRNHYTVTRDGQRFLMVTVPENQSAAPLVVVLNWTPTSARP